MNPFEFTFKDEYELALKQGNKRFGSECKHKKIKKGICQNCLRKVITKIPIIGGKK
jgi:hypothetical protein